MNRRRFLGLGLVAVGLAGCTRQRLEPVPATESARSRSPIPAPGTQPGADEDVRAAVASTELGLISLYRAALVSIPDRAQQLQAVLDDHVQHLASVSPQAELLAAGQSPPAGATTAGEDRDSGQAPARVRLRELIAAEARAQQQHAAACQAAQDPVLARTMCLIGASEAQHAVVLRRSAAGRTS